MKRSIHAFVCFSVLILLFTNCRKKAFDEFYARPENLQPPIYQILQERGNFSNFLACIDKAGYRTTLGSAGSWTVFAPTDEAFAAFFAENSISGINGITDSLAAKIVRTSMVYDGEKIDRLNDNFTAAGWVADQAFRRRTVYYDFVESGVRPDGRSVKYISTNRAPGFGYVGIENNNKFISYFFNDYMTPRGLGEADYKAFYPQSNYTGLNIAGAEIDPVGHDILAENGVIHIVNKVLTPEKSVDQYLKDRPTYSLFKSVLDRFATYTYNAEVSRRYQVLTGKTDSVFVKGFSGIRLALNNENFDKEDPNDAQVNNNSVTVPTNAAMEDYAKKVLLKYYPAGTTVLDLFDSNPVILREYVNAHLYNTQLWPSKFNTQNNIMGEAPKINSSNIVETKLLSNGAFYGVNASQRPGLFHTVYGNVILDPKYSFMRRALDQEGYNLTLSVPSLRYMLILIPDNVFYAMGFSYDSYFPGDPIRYGTGSGRVMLRRILQQHIVPLENYPIPNLSQTGLLETLNGEYIQYSNNRLASRGTLDSADVSKTSIRVDSTNVGTTSAGPANGVAVYTPGLLSYSDRTIGRHLIDMGAENSNSPYFKFYDYLKRSSLYNTSTHAVEGVSVGLNYTFLIPDNTAMNAAIAAGLLPTLPTASSILDRERVAIFMKYHILKNSFAIDGKKTGAFESLYKDLDDVVRTVTVTSNTSAAVTLLDNANRTVSTELANSNKLGDRIVIHSLKSYLDYRKN